MTQDEINAVKKAAEKMRKQQSAQNEIIEMTRQAGGFDATPEFLERFANLVAAKEREACAKVCEQNEILIPIDVWHGSTKNEMTKHTALALAAAIRARGEQG